MSGKVLVSLRICGITNCFILASHDTTLNKRPSTLEIMTSEKILFLPLAAIETTAFCILS